MTFGNKRPGAVFRGLVYASVMSMMLWMLIIWLVWIKIR